MSIAAYLKEIGRGHAGARSLGAEQARDLLGRILDGQVSDLEVGAFALAMRMKGETADELAGFLDAAMARCLVIDSSRPVIVVPSYNGARRLPNLTPLLAMRLAQEGARVLVHGPRHEASRVGSAAMFEALGLAPCDGAAAVHDRWRRHQPAFVSTEVLSPPLQRLLDLRRVLGLRNSGHSVAKLLPVVSGAPVLQLSSYTHPEFGRLMAELATTRAMNLQLLRGTEGEPVADPRRCPRIDTWLAGQAQPDLGCPAQDGVLLSLPVLPQAIDAATVALYIQAVVAGARPSPPPLDTQVGLLLDTLARLAGTSHPVANAAKLAPAEGQRRPPARDPWPPLQAGAKTR